MGKEELTSCKIPSQCVSHIADPYYIVVPTGGFWANPAFSELINRAVFTKSIVAIDSVDGTSTGFPKLVEDGANVANKLNCTDDLTASLDKLVKCIKHNNGVISPSADPIIDALILDYNTQAVIAHSCPSKIPIPNDPTAKFNVANIEGRIVPFHKYETAFINS
jgi:hypothetical protein